MVVNNAIRKDMFIWYKFQLFELIYYMYLFFIDIVYSFIVPTVNYQNTNSFCISSVLSHQNLWYLFQRDFRRVIYPNEIKATGYTFFRL